MSTAAPRSRSRKAKGRQSEPSTPASGRSTSSVSTPLNESSRQSRSIGTGRQGGAKEQSPARTQRIEEKKKFQDLNHRLEFYILGRRNVDSEREALLTALKESKEKESERVAAARKAFQDENARLRRERDNATNDAAKSATDLAAALADKNALEERDQANEEYLREARDNLRTVSDELRLAKSENMMLSANQKDLEHANTGLKSERERLTADLADARKQRDVANQKHNSIQAIYDGLRADRDRLDKQLKDLQKRYNQEHEAMAGSNAKIEKSIRAEYNNQLNKILADRQQQYETEKEEMSNHLKTAYDIKLDAHRKKVSDLGHEKEIALAEARQEKIARIAADQNCDTLRAVNRAQEARIKALEDNMKLEQERPNRELESKTTLVTKLKEAYERKEKEFENLMDIKVQLGQELKVYKDMLDREEERLKATDPTLKSPSKKRKRSDGTSVRADGKGRGGGTRGRPSRAEGQTRTEPEAKPAGQPGARSSASGQTPGDARMTDQPDSKDAAEPMVDEPEAPVDDFHNMIVAAEHEDYVELKNTTAHAICLGDWKITPMDEGHPQVEFPDDEILGPGETIPVYKREDCAPPDSLWCPNNLSITDGVKLLAPNGDCVASFRVGGKEKSDLDRSCIMM